MWHLTLEEQDAITPLPKTVSVFRLHTSVPPCSMAITPVEIVKGWLACICRISIQHLTSTVHYAPLYTVYIQTVPYSYTPVNTPSGHATPQNLDVHHPSYVRWRWEHLHDRFADLHMTYSKTSYLKDPKANCHVVTAHLSLCESCTPTFFPLARVRCAKKLW